MKIAKSQKGLKGWILPTSQKDLLLSCYLAYRTHWGDGTDILQPGMQCTVWRNHQPRDGCHRDEYQYALAKNASYFEVSALKAPGFPRTTDLNAGAIDGLIIVDWVATAWELSSSLLLPPPAFAVAFTSCDSGCIAAGFFSRDLPAIHYGDSA